MPSCPSRSGGEKKRTQTSYGVALAEERLLAPISRTAIGRLDRTESHRGISVSWRCFVAALQADRIQLRGRRPMVRVMNASNA